MPSQANNNTVPRHTPNNSQPPPPSNRNLPPPPPSSSNKPRPPSGQHRPPSAPVGEGRCQHLQGAQDQQQDKEECPLPHPSGDSSATLHLTQMVAETARLCTAVIVVLMVLGAVATVEGSRNRRCDCPWGLWGSWTSCSERCDGGTMSRTRHRDSCCYPSSDSETMTCNTQSCCSCEWGNWHAWSSCSQTCGEGGSSATYWNSEHLILTIVGVLSGVVLVASLVWYKGVRDPNRVIDLRGKL
uniref:Uncharacterized protein n=1 Tax=Branchiostoma floridae TaxID=7739 RepID=C3Z8I7_BRAFL|eukprot:XP_002595081.1 hypothetical protein BRAFLDRAFT_90191 [Branchiostoma floridae]